ncbi:roadblock/LC7 domain-containing protein [Candidatus Bathyarchaeota archaeon]|nr:roadblock/LC7 domain-containing protein [Candidatus Bathyarchaeota archaeon]
MKKIKGILDELKSYDGIIGYIIKNGNTAKIDLKDPSRLIDYVILSNSIKDAAEELAKTFNLGSIKYAVIEGKKAKIIAKTIGKNELNIFVEKTAKVDTIIDKLAT